ncbi:MAG: hypothetical protein IKD52_15780, partial [Exiguobacterium sp.]|nr:hypothetical protein [Exiguobacterium sp.]
ENCRPKRLAFPIICTPTSDVCPSHAAAYLFWLFLSGTNGIVWIETNERNYVTVILTYIWKETPFVFLNDARDV